MANGINKNTLVGKCQVWSGVRGLSLSPGIHVGEQCHMAGKKAGSSMAKERHGIISEEFGIFYSIENGDSSFGLCSIRIVQNQTWLVGA